MIHFAIWFDQASLVEFNAPVKVEHTADLEELNASVEGQQTEELGEIDVPVKSQDDVGLKKIKYFFMV